MSRAFSKVALLLGACACTAAAPTRRHRKNHLSNSDCIHPDSRGYLLPVSFSQQFNNQLITFAENMKLAQKLGRVLVLIGFLEQKSYGGQAQKSSDGVDWYDSERELHDTSDIFDVYASLTANGLSEDDWVTLDAFKQLCPGLKAEAHAFIPTWEPLIESGSERFNATWKVPEHMYQCEQEKWPTPCNADGWKNFRAVDIPGLSDIQFVDVMQFAHDKDQVLNLTSLPTGKEVPVLVTDGLFFKTDATEPKYAADPQEVLGSLTPFKFIPAIYDRATSFINKHFGRHGGDYIAMHWRQGYTDGTVLIRESPDVVDKLSEAGQALLNSTHAKHYKRHGLPDIYIATNKYNRTAFDVLEGLLGTGQKIYSLQDDTDTLDLDLNTISHVEQSVCARAKDFVPTPGSTWSYNVRAFRGLTDPRYAILADEMSTFLMSKASMLKKTGKDK